VGGYLEKHLALEVAQRLKKELQRKLKAEVLMTRSHDLQLSLAERVAAASRRDPTLFLSIHGNSMTGKKKRESVQGIETYFLSATASGEAALSTATRENTEVSVGPKPEDTLDFILRDLKRSDAHFDSSRLAHAVHERLVAVTGAVDRGVQQAPFFVLTGVEAPAILVEVGFLSHPEEGRKLRKKAYQAQLASAIAEGVAAFLGPPNAPSQAHAAP
jgi:N-acetylmuramoyl-L-alanine amidase